MLPPDLLTYETSRHGPWMAAEPRTCRERHEGVQLQRRSVFGLGLLGAASLGSASSARAEAPLRRFPGRPTDEDDACTPLPLNEFLERLQGAVERALATEPRREDAYLFESASLLARLERASLPEVDFKPFPRLEGTEIATLKRTRTFVVDEVRVAHGAKVPGHNHGGSCGALLGLQGEVRIHSFDPVSGAMEPPGGKSSGHGNSKPGTSLRIRESSRRLLLPGQAATLSPTRDSMHEVTAGKDGAIVLDIFTFLHPLRASGFFERDDEPSDPDALIYDAHWI